MIPISDIMEGNPSLLTLGEPKAYADTANVLKNEISHLLTASQLGPGDQRAAVSKWISSRLSKIDDLDSIVATCNSTVLGDVDNPAVGWHPAVTGYLSSARSLKGTTLIDDDGHTHTFDVITGFAPFWRSGSMDLLMIFEDDEAHDTSHGRLVAYHPSWTVYDGTRAAPGQIIDLDTDDFVFWDKDANWPQAIDPLNQGYKCWLLYVEKWDLATAAQTEIYDYMALATDSINGGDSNFASLISQGINSKNARVQEFAQFLTPFNANNAGSAILQYILTGIHGLSEASEESTAGVFSVSDYIAPQTYGLLVGAWSLLKGFGSVIATVAMIAGKGIVAAVGAVVYVASSMFNGLRDTISSSTNLRYGKGTTHFYADAVNASFSYYNQDDKPKNTLEQRRVVTPFGSLMVEATREEDTSVMGQATKTRFLFYPSCFCTVASIDPWLMRSRPLDQGETRFLPLLRSVYASSGESESVTLSPLRNQFGGLAFSEWQQSQLGQISTIPEDMTGVASTVVKNVALFAKWMAYHICLRFGILANGEFADFFGSGFSIRDMYTYSGGGSSYTATFNADWLRNYYRHAYPGSAKADNWTDFCLYALTQENPYTSQQTAWGGNMPADLVSYEKLHQFLSCGDCHFDPTRPYSSSWTDYYAAYDDDSFWSLILRIVRSVVDFQISAAHYSSPALVSSWGQYVDAGRPIAPLFNAAVGRFFTDLQTGILTIPVSAGYVDGQDLETCGIDRTTMHDYASSWLDLPSTTSFPASSRQCWTLDPVPVVDDEPEIVSDPFISPPLVSLASVRLAIAGALLIGVTTLTAATVVRAKVRRRKKLKAIQREGRAVDAQAAYLSDPTSKEKAQAFVKAQRRFQRYASRIGYASNTVGSFSFSTAASVAAATSALYNLADSVNGEGANTNVQTDVIYQAIVG